MTNNQSRQCERVAASSWTGRLAKATRILTVSALLTALGWLAGTHAAVAEDEGWTFSLTPYLWLTMADGSISIGGGSPPDIPISASAEDVLTNLDFAFMLSGEARHDRIGLLVDLLYVDLNSATPAPFGKLWTEANVDTKAFLGTAAVAYRVYRNRPGWIDTYAGVRVIDFRGDVTLEPGLAPELSSDLHKTLVDPVVGARAHIDLGDGMSVSGAFDVGGFGVGTDLTWQVLGTVDYAFNDWMTLRVGFRHLSIDYSQGDTALDLDLTGPIAGLSFRF